MMRLRWSILACVHGVALAFAAPASGQALLGTAQQFAVLGGSTVTNTGATVVSGELGVSPGGAVSGFPPGVVVGGTIHAADAVALQAQSDLTTAYVTLAGMAFNGDMTGTDLGGLTLIPGVYRFTTSAQLTGTLTLDAQGNPDAVFVFQIGSTLTTASNASVVVINGAQACNVFWQVGSSATVGTGTAFIGNVLALTSITLSTGASVSGRALARNGAVTLDTNGVAATACSEPPVAPTLRKAFAPATIAAGASATLTITLSNIDTAAATLSADLVDALPIGVLVAALPNASTTCGGGLLATAGGSSVTLLAGNAIPAGSGTTAGTCTVSVDVTAAAGVYLNTLPAGALQTSNGANGAAAAATLTVTGNITLGKTFTPAAIVAGDSATLVITLGNTTGSAANLTAPLIDLLPAGVVIAAVPNASTTCDGSGAVSASAGGNSVTLPATRSIPAASTCTVSVDVTAAAGASYVNVLAIGALQTDQGTNAVPADATLVVNAGPPAPTLSKGFVAASIAAGGTSTLTITLINPSGNAATLTGALTDSLPAGVVVAATPNASTTCIGGTLAGPPMAGDTSITLDAGASIPAASGTTAGTCTVTVDVTAPAGGTYLNTLPAGALVTDEGSNAAPASATLAVVDTTATPPALSKRFSPSSIALGDDAILIITLLNPNASPATLTAPLTDLLPSGLVIAAVPNASTTCPGSGAVAATPAGTTLVLPATRAIPGGNPGSCIVRVTVTATTIGSFANVIAAGALQTTNGDNPLEASDTLVVVTPAPALSTAATLLALVALALVAGLAIRRRAPA